MRNSSLVKRSCAEDLSGLKLSTEDADFPPQLRGEVVGEHPICAEGHDVSRAGANGRENVGMSNRKSDEISDRRKPKVSLAM